MNIPAELLYNLEHVWVKIEGNLAYVGITDYAQKKLGDIVFVDIENIGETFTIGEAFGSIEAVKTVSDLHMPVSGKILELNSELENSPNLVNRDPYGKGWIIKIELKNSSIDHLVNAEKYKKYVD